MRWKGSIFVAGAAVQWLRDGLGIIEQARPRPDRWPAQGRPGQQVYLVPAFTGSARRIGMPMPAARMFGLTRGTGPGELARAALEAVCFQTRDLSRRCAPTGPRPDGADTVLRVDGGMVASDWTMQFLADLLGRAGRPPLWCSRPRAVGAAYLAGLRCDARRRTSFYPEGLQAEVV
jgi:glycerol kinase